MTATLGSQARIALAGERPSTANDIPRLATLMHAAYRGTVDEEEETIEEALIEVHKTFDGERGPFMSACSRVIEVGDELVSATLLTRWKDRPFVAFAMTAPHWKRKGLARACMINSMQDVLAAGDDRLSLVVTLANVAALTPYQSLGFQPGR